MAGTREASVPTSSPSAPPIRETLRAFLVHQESTAATSQISEQCPVLSQFDIRAQGVAMLAIRGALAHGSRGTTHRVGALLVVALLLLLSSPANAASRVRIEQGARARQVRLAPANLNTSCAVLDDGTVRCWGLNVYGQAGDGTVATPKKSPVTVMTGQTTILTSMVSVSAGYSHSCAVGAIGSAFCWGSNFYGELGTGNTTQSAFAVQVRNITNVVAIAAGYLFTCAMRSDGTVWCWGVNAAGELGNGSAVAQSTTPVQVHLAGAAVAITAGTAQACAVLVGGHVQCWGSNAAGQLGDGTYTTRFLPVTVAFLSRFLGLQPLSNVVDVSAGDRHTCALIVDGTVFCWGANDSGQLGANSTAANSNVAVGVVTDAGMDRLAGVVAASAGTSHSCALLASGAVKCWGADDKGQLGIGTTSTTPHRLADTTVAGLANAVEVVTGLGYSCAIEAVGWTGRCWGDNSSGELGNGTTTQASVPNTVFGVSGSIGGRGIQTSSYTSCARRGNDTVACWGDGYEGELGNGSLFSDSPNAGTVSGLNDVVSLSAGSFRHFCALHASGTVSCWGSNSTGALGNGNKTDQATPVAVVGLTGVVQLAAGDAHTCALLVDGTVRCWGRNSAGQLGNATYSDSLFPVAVSGLGSVVMISAGVGHSCAVLVDGTARCWGDNFFGELGDSKAEVMSPVPVAVLGLNTVVAISAGSSYSCALSATGGANCWGKNDHGQLGDSTINDQSVPDTVMGLTTALALATGGEGSHTCALLAGGSASCWGENDDGELGAKDLAEYHSPTPVIDHFATVNGVQIAFPLSGVIAIDTGQFHSCALVGNGGPKCWGANFVGEIGNGSFSSEVLRPTTVNSFTANVEPEATVRSSGRTVEVTALVNCPEGAEAHLSLSLRQGETTGNGMAVTVCTGGQAEVPMVIAARGSQGFAIGSATAFVEAVVEDRGNVTEDQHWSRSVTISLPP